MGEREYINQAVSGRWAARARSHFARCAGSARNHCAASSRVSALEGSTISGKQLPNGEIRGTKFAPGSVGAAQLRDGAIDSLHIQNAVINIAHIASAAINDLSASAITAMIWGPDYADPQTYTDPFGIGNTYNFMELCEGYEAEDGTKIYNNMVDAAKTITDDMQARYLAFAEAEAYLIDNAFIIPFGYGSGGYTASRLNPFESQYAPFGLSNERYKGQALLQEPMGTDAYFDAYDAWLEARAALAE